MRLAPFSIDCKRADLRILAQNGPSAPGTSALGFARPNGGASGDWTAVRQDLVVGLGMRFFPVLLGESIDADAAAATMDQIGGVHLWSAPEKTSSRS